MYCGGYINCTFDLCNAYTVRIQHRIQRTPYFHSRAAMYGNKLKKLHFKLLCTCTIHFFPTSNAKRGFSAGSVMHTRSPSYILYGGDNELRLLFSNFDRRTPRKTISLKAEQKNN